MALVLCSLDNGVRTCIALQLHVDLSYDPDEDVGHDIGVARNKSRAG